MVEEVNTGTHAPTQAGDGGELYPRKLIGGTDRLPPPKHACEYYDTHSLE